MRLLLPLLVAVPGWPDPVHEPESEPAPEEMPGSGPGSFTFTGSSRVMLALLALSLTGCPKHAHRPAGQDVPYPPLEEAALDREADPCEDFYQFACGGWIATTPLPPDRTRWVRGVGELEERDARLVRRILEDAGAGRVEAQERFGRKAGDVYAACMDEADVEASGLAELQAQWARLDAVTDRSDLLDELGRLEAMGVGPLGVRARLEPGAANRLLVLGQEGIGLRARRAPPAPGPGQGDPYLEHVRTLLTQAGRPAAKVEAEAAAAVELARALRGVSPGPEGTGPSSIPERMAPAALQKFAPNVPWPRLLRALGAERLPVLGVADRAFLARFDRAFGEAPLDAWKAHLRAELVEALAARRALPAPLVQEWFRYLGTVEPVPAELPPRWRHCVEETTAVLPVAVGNAFARRHLGGSDKERAGWLLSRLRRGAAVVVQSAPWVDASTQARASAKLERMVVQLGHPEAGPDYGSLRATRESFLRNVLSAGRFAVAQEVARATRPADRGEWLLGPAAPELSYSPEQNVLCIPAGALQPPLYVPQATDAVLFGTMGVAMGRRLADALQGEGRRRGPDGKLEDLWTPAAAQGFEARTRCLVEQFEGYEPAPDLRLDGRRTLAANLSDLAGLRAAYEAMRDERAVNPAQEKRQAGFSPDQQFFVAYAQSLCTTASDDDLAHEVAEGTEAPAPYRVNGPLSNLPEFARAFRCAPEKPMVRPEGERCDVW